MEYENIDLDVILRKELLSMIQKCSKYPDLYKKIFSKTPQSFSQFPTLILKMTNNIDDGIGKSLNNIEYVDDISIQVEIYSKDITYNGKKISSLAIISDLKPIIHKFFRELGFERTISQPSEYIDITIDRYIFLFNAKISSWNNYII